MFRRRKVDRLPEIVECPAILFNDGEVSDVFFFKYELRSDGYHPKYESFVLSGPCDSVRVEAPDGCWAKPFSGFTDAVIYWGENLGGRPLERCEVGSIAENLGMNQSREF